MHYQELALREDGSACLDCFVQDPEISVGHRKTRPALIVCPGGAYLTLSRREGEPVALRFAGMGYQAFVCRYLTFIRPPADVSKELHIQPHSHYPEQLIDLMRAVALVREHAQEWGIDPQRVYVAGFSAGAHLCGMLAENWDDPDVLARAGIAAEDAALVRPDGVIMGYPMLNASPKLENRQPIPHEELFIQALFGTKEPDPEMMDRVDLVRHVRPDMPRVFVWHTAEDRVVSPRDTVALVDRMLELGVPCELHLYQCGPHGQALCDATSAARTKELNAQASSWPAAAHAWMQQGYEDAPLSD